MPKINKEENMKEGLLTSSAFLMGLFLLAASIVWAAAAYVVNRFRITQAYNYARGLFMGNNNSEVIFQTRSPVDRRRGEDRRSFLKLEYLDHNPERRNIMIRRRKFGDRRELLPVIA